MAKAGRIILAVVAGAAVWAALWLGGNQGLKSAFPEILAPEAPITHLGMLLTLIVYSAALSILAGFVTAMVAGSKAMQAVWALATLQLILGIIAQASYWNLMPIWYHIIFLALIIPATLFGGRLRMRRMGAPVRVTH